MPVGFVREVAVQPENIFFKLPFEPLNIGPVPLVSSKNIPGRR